MGLLDYAPYDKTKKEEICYKGEIVFPITAREGDVMRAFNGEVFNLLVVMKMLAGNYEKQCQALEILGISLNDRLVDILVSESGKPYSDTHKDRTKVELQKMVRSVHVQFVLENTPPDYLHIDLSIQPWTEEGVNFYRSLTVKAPDNKIFNIPVTGRGTIALEGRLDDAHAGLCTDGNSASFQTRCAMLHAVSVSLGASKEQLYMLGAELMKLNDVFHGRDDLLYFTTYCATHNPRLNYLRWIVQRYHKTDTTPLQVQTMVEYGRPHSNYWVNLRQIFTRQELEEDYFLWEKLEKQKEKNFLKVCFCFLNNLHLNL